MATRSRSNSRLDLNSVLEQAASQFRDLNPNQPGQWPVLPKAVSFVGVGALVVLLGWFVALSGADDDLNAERSKEPALKQDYRGKLAQAINLPELRKQKLLVQEYVTQLEKQLPGKAEMDALLSDINQAGVGRGLQFELFRPGQVAVKDYYAELPISVRVTGRFHDIGAFASDVANLSRIVTLHNLALTANTKDPSTGILTMDATARTYRYLDPKEVAEQQKAAAAAKSGKARGAKPAAGAKP